MANASLQPSTPIPSVTRHGPRPRLREAAEERSRLIGEWSRHLFRLSPTGAARRDNFNQRFSDGLLASLFVFECSAHRRHTDAYGVVKDCCFSAAIWWKKNWGFRSPRRAGNFCLHSQAAAWWPPSRRYHAGLSLYSPLRGPPSSSASHSSYKIEL